MCGISCIVDLRKQVSRDSVVEGSVKQDLSKEIESSLDEIDHRGPDARGHWMSKCDRVGSPMTSVSGRCLRYTRTDQAS